MESVYLPMARSLQGVNLESLCFFECLLQPIQVFFSHLLMEADFSSFFFQQIEFSAEIRATLEVHNHVLDWFLLGRKACLDRDNFYASPNDPLNFLAQLDALDAESMHLMGVLAISLQHHEDFPSVVRSAHNTICLDDDGVTSPLAVFLDDRLGDGFVLVPCHCEQLRLLEEPLSIHFTLFDRRPSFVRAGS